MQMAQLFGHMLSVGIPSYHFRADPQYGTVGASSFFCVTTICVPEAFIAFHAIWYVARLCCP